MLLHCTPNCKLDSSKETLDGSDTNTACQLLQLQMHFLFRFAPLWIWLYTTPHTATSYYPTLNLVLASDHPPDRPNSAALLQNRLESDKGNRRLVTDVMWYNIDGLVRMPLPFPWPANVSHMDTWSGQSSGCLRHCCTRVYPIAWHCHCQSRPPIS
jgi:hypothetical protein